MTSYLGGPETMRLDYACGPVSEALGETCYLVGSATKGREYRDVDVRLIMNDDKFEALFGECPQGLSPLRLLLGLAISCYMAVQTGLPVDFQIQKRSSVAKDDWDKFRYPLGNRTTQRDSSGHWLGPPWMKNDG